jgi:hypothetical protein
MLIVRQNRSKHAGLDQINYLRAWANGGMFAIRLSGRTDSHWLKPERARPDNLTFILAVDFANHRSRPHTVSFLTNAGYRRRLVALWPRRAVLARRAGGRVR